MTDRPILFSAPMVRALLAGTKTQTRRQIKPRGKRPSLFNGDWSDSYVLDPGNESWRKQDVPIEAGDRLWVKETWAPLSALTHNDPGTQGLADGGFYRADEGTVDGEISRWKPSIFMPRHASRITLIVTDVRVERLQNISEEDAVAEGIVEDDGSEPDIFYLPGSHLISGVNAPKGRLPIGQHSDPRLVYRDLVNNLHGGDLWKDNPWVVAYTFTVHRGNINQIGGAA